MSLGRLCAFLKTRFCLEYFPHFGFAKSVMVVYVV